MASVSLKDQFQYPLVRNSELGPNATYYDRLIAAPSDEEIEFTLWLWSSFTYLLAIPTTMIFVSIALTPKVRKCPFNLFLLFLMLPDLGGLWVCATSCLVNALVGHYTTVEHCQFQAFCLIWSVGANAWLNAAITRHLLVMLRSARKFQKYQPPSQKQVVTESLAVYGYALFLASWFVVDADWWPFKTRLVWGTLCLPRAIDDTTSIWLHACFFPLWFCFPLAYVCYAGLAIWAQKLLPQRGRRRILAIYFGRLMLSFLVMWIPCLVLLFVASAFGNWAHAMGGLFGHLQAAVSACISLMKPDIWKAFQDFYRPLCTRCFGAESLPPPQSSRSLEYTYDWETQSVAERPEEEDDDDELWFYERRKTARMRPESFLAVQDGDSLYKEGAVLDISA